MNKLLIAALVAAGLSTAMTSSFAQTETPSTNGRHIRHSDDSHHAKRQFQMPSARAEGRIAYLQTALKITDAQKPQWETFASAMRKQALEADKRVQERQAQTADHSKRQHLGTIERLEKRQQMMAAGAQRLNEIIGAGKPLYASLSPEQKQIADKLLVSGHGRNGHKRHHRMQGNA